MQDKACHTEEQNGGYEFLDFGALKDNKGTLIGPCLIALIVLYCSLVESHSIPPYQWAVLLSVTLLSAVVFGRLSSAKTRFKGDTALVYLTYLAVSIALFHPTITNIFRSDYWYILKLFQGVEGFSLEDLKRLSLFELFGDMRFQPLAHLMMYFRHLLLADNIILYHLLNIAVHALTGLMVFALLARVIRNYAFAFIFGLIFIGLPSQFDTVVWTYHIYIMSGAILLLAAVLLAIRFADTGKSSYMAFSGLFSLASILLYEPAIVAPVALFCITFLALRLEGNNLQKGLIVKAAICVVTVYLLYILVTLYGYSLVKDTHKMATGDLLSAENIGRTIKGMWVNIYGSLLLKNIGIAAQTKIVHIVYMSPPEGVFSELQNILKLIVASFLVVLIRPVKGWRLIVLIIVGLGLSYLSIISLGRVYSNTLEYLISQPRYLYFPNAALTVAAGALLWKSFNRETLRPVMLAALGAVFFWNAHNVLIANNSVDKHMAFLDDPYYAIRSFTKENPSAKVKMDYNPFNGGRFYLGADIALDLMLGDRLTKFPTRATHIYTKDNRIIKNPAYAKGAASPLLKDFTVSWIYRPFKVAPPWKDVEIVGSKDNFPRVLLTIGGQIKVELKNEATGKIELYKLRHPYLLEKMNFFARRNDGWAEMIVSRSGDQLCFYFNGELLDRTVIGSGPYSNWQADGKELIGSHFIGYGGASYIADLFIEPELTGSKCSLTKRIDK